MKDFFLFYPMMVFQNFMVTLSFRFIADKHIGGAVSIDALFFTINYWIARRIAQRANASPWTQYLGYVLGGITGIAGAMLLTQ